MWVVVVESESWIKLSFKTQFHIRELSLCYCFFAKLCMPLWPHELQHVRLLCLHHLSKFAQIHVHWVSDAIQPSYPLSSSSLDLNLSQHHGLFQRVSSSHQVVTLLGELQLQHQFFNEYARLISLRTDWFDLAVQGTLKSLLQHHSSKASILQHSAFFMVQLSYLYMKLK